MDVVMGVSFKLEASTGLMRRAFKASFAAAALCAADLCPVAELAMAILE
jgi:hypothetical protein